jgi:hypothetical protein
LLFAIFVLSLKYQDQLVESVKKLFIREKPLPPKPRPVGIQKFRLKTLGTESSEVQEKITHEPIYALLRPSPPFHSGDSI